MQNDVVRWPEAGKCNKTIKNKGCYAQYAGNVKRQRFCGHQNANAAETITSQANVAATTSAAVSTATSATRTTHFLRQNFKTTKNENISQQSPKRCDNTTTTTTDYYDIYLVHNVVRGKSRQSYLHENLQDDSCCLKDINIGRCRPLLSKNRFRIELRNCYSLLLQACMVMFVCSLNVGFVAVKAAAHGVVSNNSASSYLEMGNLPYELDYGHEESNKIQDHYTHTWAVHVPDGDKDGKADMVARDHGFVNYGKIFEDHYHFAHQRVAKRSLSPALHHQSRLNEDNRVHWAQQQIAKSRRKRDYIRMRPSRTSSRSTFSLADTVPFDDPKWPHMWYLNRGGDLDMNVIPAWKEGITGKGIVVTILDDGLESDHPDIISNYDPNASYDVNSHDPNPMPHYDLTDSNRHGTRCAGEVAATANNSICAVGIAFGASVGGVRMLDGDVTDAVEARSLSLNPQHIDIYSASWGPDDDGKTVDGPGELASRAFIEGVTKGRAGKGSIFIWASGNGGRELDNCNCDGYTNSIWTLSISSATEDGYVPWYSEKCSSTLATTYSSGSQNEKQVVTTDLHHSCTVSHTGTSASAPLAAGIAALVLESNKNLTWRDMQHIVVRTAKPANLIDSTWSKNGVGRRVSHSFGYGLMDASAMVKTARNWKTVPEQQRCEINAPHVDKVIPPKSHITLQLSVKNCLNINFLEHVQAKITLTSQRRGDIQLNLISPAGTKVTLLTPRVHDTSHSGFNQWPFMSVHTWGESPHGNWQLEIHNEGRYMGHALLREWSLIFYGTTQSIDPNDPVSTPRTNFDITTPNSSSSSTTSLYQIYSAQYPRIPPNNFVFSKVGTTGKLAASKLPNKSVYVAPNLAAANDPLNQATSSNKKLATKQGLSTIALNSKNSKQNKNGKGKSQENTKSNKNFSSSSKVSTAAKESNQTQSQSSKNKFYRISQQNKMTNAKAKNPMDNSKPKNAKIQQSAEKVQSLDEKPSRKVIGDLPQPTTNGKLPATGQATGNIKPPLKATKQVKESSNTKLAVTTTTTQVTLTNRGSSSLESNQRITKLFERYEKIQSIFPEFHPYQPGTKDNRGKNTTTTTTSSLSTSSSSSVPIKITKIIQANVETKLVPSTTGSFTKPSRENTRKLPATFLPDQTIIKNQQLLLAAAGVHSEETQNPLSGIKSSPQRKNSNAQITQWDLIFYGTEIPAQPEDPPNNANSKFNTFGVEIDRNDLEYDPKRQWHEMQQLGESSMMTKDRTNTSCLKTTINRQCLVCAPPTVFYRGHCYEFCPPYTYAVRQINRNGLTEQDDTKAVTNNLMENNEDDELISQDRRKRRHKFYNTAITSETFLQCNACDKSCLYCNGPLNSHCTGCSSGSQLRSLPHTNETYCINYAERSLGNTVGVKQLPPAAGNYHAIIVLIFLVPSIVVALTVVVLRKYETFWCNKRSENRVETGAKYTYDRVALIADDEEDVEEDHDDDDDCEEHEDNKIAAHELNTYTDAEDKSNISIYIDNK